MTTTHGVIIHWCVEPPQQRDTNVLTPPRLVQPYRDMHGGIRCPGTDACTGHHKLVDHHSRSIQGTYTGRCISQDADHVSGIRWSLVSPLPTRDQQNAHKEMVALQDIELSPVPVPLSLVFQGTRSLPSYHVTVGRETVWYVYCGGDVGRRCPSSCRVVQGMVGHQVYELGGRRLWMLHVWDAWPSTVCR